MTLNLQTIRDQYPSLNKPNLTGDVPIFFDNPAGTQVPQRVIDAYQGYYEHMNANAGGFFLTSQYTDKMTTETRQLLADFINAPNADEIVIGPNMTTLCFSLSRAIAKTLKPGDEIVLTRMDHDANVTPWTLIADDLGLTVRWVDLADEGARLDLNTLEAALTDRTKIVATVHASNAVGTINPVQRIAEMAHAAGAYHVVDAVQSAPHIPLDVQAIGCDFLLCSAYKFFGPHIGIMWGKYDLLADLPVYKVRPAKDKPPYRWEIGTPSFEGIAATRAALEYIADIGEQFGADYAGQFSQYNESQRTLKQGMEAIRIYEQKLVRQLIDALQAIPGVKIYGITDPAQVDERCPTVVFTHDTYQPGIIAQHLAENNVYAWSGHYYALEIMASLGRAEHGMVRIGLAHYNTSEEITRFADVLGNLVSN